MRDGKSKNLTFQSKNSGEFFFPPRSDDLREVKVYYTEISIGN
jgi:hypothetical protein